MDANGDDGNDDGSMLAGGVEEQRDEGVVMRGHPSEPNSILMVLMDLDVWTYSP